MNGEDDEGEVVVWQENRHIVEVFTRCRWRTQIVVGADRSQRMYEGIDASEVESCCNLLSIPQPERADVLMGVRVMEAVAMPILNEAR